MAKSKLNENADFLMLNLEEGILQLQDDLESLEKIVYCQDDDVSHTSIRFIRQSLETESLCFGILELLAKLINNPAIEKYQKLKFDNNTKALKFFENYDRMRKQSISEILQYIEE